MRAQWARWRVEKCLTVRCLGEHCRTGEQGEGEYMVVLIFGVSLVQLNNDVKSQRR